VQSGLLIKQSSSSYSIDIAKLAGCAAPPAPTGEVWQQVAYELEQMKLRAEPYTSHTKLAAEVGIQLQRTVSPNTVKNAIDRTPALEAWGKPQKKSISNLPALSGAERSREIVPGTKIDEPEFQQLMTLLQAQAKTPEERKRLEPAEFQTMRETDPERFRELVATYTGDIDDADQRDRREADKALRT
jgi:hypothetical protein